MLAFSGAAVGQPVMGLRQQALMEMEKPSDSAPKIAAESGKAAKSTPDVNCDDAISEIAKLVASGPAFSQVLGDLNALAKLRLANKLNGSDLDRKSIKNLVFKMDQEDQHKIARNAIEESYQKFGKKADIDAAISFVDCNRKTNAGKKCDITVTADNASAVLLMMSKSPQADVDEVMKTTELDAAAVWAYEKARKNAAMIDPAFKLDGEQGAKMDFVAQVKAIKKVDPEEVQKLESSSQEAFKAAMTQLSADPRLKKCLAASCSQDELKIIKDAQKKLMEFVLNQESGKAAGLKGGLLATLDGKGEIKVGMSDQVVKDETTQKLKPKIADKQPARKSSPSRVIAAKDVKPIPGSTAASALEMILKAKEGDQFNIGARGTCSVRVNSILTPEGGSITHNVTLTDRESGNQETHPIYSSSTSDIEFFITHNDCSKKSETEEAKAARLQKLNDEKAKVKADSDLQALHARQAKEVIQNKKNQEVASTAIGSIMSSKEGDQFVIGNRGNCSVRVTAILTPEGGSRTWNVDLYDSVKNDRQTLAVVRRSNSNDIATFLTSHDCSQQK